MSRIVLGATGAPLNSTFIAGLQCKVLDAYGKAYCSPVYVRRLSVARNNCCIGSRHAGQKAVHGLHFAGQFLFVLAVTA